MEKLELQKEKIRLSELADKLDVLQREKNRGRGVSCVQTIIMYLRQGNLEKAKAVCRNEQDKIDDALGTYSDIKNFLIENLFSGEPDHPWRLIDDFRKKKRGEK